jgi:hypothetical protein
MKVIGACSLSQTLPYRLELLLPYGVNVLEKKHVAVSEFANAASYVTVSSKTLP